MPEQKLLLANNDLWKTCGKRIDFSTTLDIAEFFYTIVNDLSPFIPQVFHRKKGVFHRKILRLLYLSLKKPPLSESKLASV